MQDTRYKLTLTRIVIVAVTHDHNKIRTYLP